METLASVAKLQASWSGSATRLKRVLDNSRKATLILGAGGALLAAIASQIPEARDWMHRDLAVASATMLGVASFLTFRLLGISRTVTWTRMRAASEALKHEMFQYAAMAAPYDELASSDSRLRQEADRIAADVDDIIDVIWSRDQPGSVPLKRFQSPEEYIEGRVKAQIAWLEDRSERCRGSAALLHRWEFSLSLAATLLTMIVSVAGKNLFGFPFDLTALTAVLTTVAGAVIAHIEASRFEFLTVSYRATARRLESELALQGQPFSLPSTAWSDFVHRCEAILANENAAWIARWSKI